MANKLIIHQAFIINQTHELFCRYSYKVNCITFRIIVKLNKRIETCTIFMPNKLVIHQAFIINQTHELFYRYSYKVNCITFRVSQKLNKRIKKFTV